MRSIGRSAAEESDVREDDDEAMIPVVEIYDARSATLAASIGGQAGSLHCDRDRLYASSPDGLQIWDIQTGENRGMAPGFAPTRYHPGRRLGFTGRG